MTKKESRDLYQEITDTIVSALEAGAAAEDFSPPWIKQGGGMPTNALTRNGYRGINVIQLWISGQERGYSSARWATFKQWKTIGASVRKGSKGTRIVFFKPIKTEDKDTGEERTFPMLRWSTVFNADQVDGDPRAGEDDAPELPDGVTREQVADDVIAATGAMINYGGDRACYAPALDQINLPIPEAFKSTDGFYSVAFHELTHWTAHKTRLDRNLQARFGDAQYAAEELIAELGAAFSLGALGISAEPRADHANYIASWIKLLKQDKKAMFTAAARAADAAEYLQVGAAKAPTLATA